jgi:tripartite ATP-independent transporter DctP family solute receptor
MNNLQPEPWEAAQNFRMTLWADVEWVQKWNQIGRKNMREFRMGDVRGRLVSALAAVAIGVTSLAGSAMAQDLKLRFSVGANESETDGMSVGLRAMRDYVAYKSGGTMEIEIFWNTLGGSLQVTEQVKNGTLDMALTDDSVLGSFYPPMQAFQIPYLFASSPAAWQFTQTDTVRGMTDDMREATGLRTLGFSQNGFRNLTNNKREVKTPADMSGLKMRTMQSQVYVEFMGAMGASATPIAWPELVPALRTGVVDGQENAAITVLDGKLYEVQKYMSVNEHVYGFHLILINDDVYKGMTVDQQKILHEAVALHSELANAIKTTADIVSVGKLRDLGMEIHVNSPTEKAMFRDMAQPAVVAFIKSQIGAEAVDKVLGAAKEAEERLYR